MFPMIGKRNYFPAVIFVLCRMIFGFETSIYTGYREGYYNPYLPGSDMDKSNSTNIPWTTDTNRYSDGFSSTAYFDTISPGFPQYEGGLASTSERVQNYIKYMQNAAGQGVAGYNEGDAVKEKAARRFLESLDATAAFPPAPTALFTVHAAIKWSE
jgi:hypothetical protein